MDIQNLVPVDYSNQRVLTTAQVAEALNIPVTNIKWIFARHKEQFQEGVHYFKVEGDALRTLKKEVANCYLNETPLKKEVANCNLDSPLLFGKGAKCLNLWTCQGAARLSKLVDTPEAWKLFTNLEKHYFNPAPQNAPQPSLFPDEPTAQKKVRRPAPECALVYAVLLSNLLVKIGLSSDFNRRLKELRKETHCDILEWATTTMLPFLDAVKFEKSCKDKFFDYVVGGEFFNAPFAEVKATLQASPVDKLLAIADRMEPSPKKNKLLNQAAALLCK